MKRFLSALFTLVLVVSLAVIGLPSPVLTQAAEVWVDDSRVRYGPGDLVDGHVSGTDAFATIQDTTPQLRVQQSYGKLPLSFEANQGQTDPRVKFLSRGNGYTLFLTPTEAVLTLSKPATPATADAEDTQATEHAVLRMQLVGANPEPDVTGLEELPGKSNYFVGNDPQQWHTNVPQYAKVRYQHIYPGVNLVYYGNQRQLEYDFVVTPGADPAVIRLKFDGANEVTIDDHGNLVLHIAGGEVLLNAPVIYQEIDGVKEAIPGHYVLQGKNQIAFQVGAYDTSKPLVIDPVLIYSTYLGGSGSDTGYGIAVDASGNAYVTGLTRSTNFPTASPFQAALAEDYDAFVTKLNADGSSLVYSTYLGGGGEDVGFDIAVDSSGNAYITGSASGAGDFPTTVGALQPALGGSYDAFVTKLNADGSALIYSTYLGGGSFDEGRGIAVDASGNAYVAGSTASTDFPTATPSQPAHAGGGDAFVTKLNATGSALVYSTYLGGSDWDTGYDIAADPSGNAYVTGLTESTNFPTTVSAFQTTSGGSTDAFVTKLNDIGTLVYCTYLGGSSFERGVGIAMDASGNAYVMGGTVSTDFPTATPFQAAFAGGGSWCSFCGDAFVTKLNATGSALVYSTYLGGSSDEAGGDIAVDSAGNAYVTGWTRSINFPKESALQPFRGGHWDAFVTVLNSTGYALIYSSFLGGGDGGERDSGNGIAVDAFGDFYVTGMTQCPDFPTANPMQPSFGGSQDAFVTKISFPPTMEIIAEAQAQYYNEAPSFSNFGFDDHISLDDGWYQMDSYSGTWTALFTDAPDTSWDSDNWTILGFAALSEGSHTIYFKASDDAGNVEGESGEWSWQFFKDTTPPAVVSTSPGDSAINVSVDTLVTATFSEAIDEATIVFTLDTMSGSVSYSGTTATFIPDANLDYSITYAASIQASDLAGNPMAQAYTWSFTTQAEAGRKGDFDNDGDIDIFDFVQFADAYGSEAGDPNYNAIGDFDDDGDIDIFDFVYFADVYGT